MRLLFAGDVMLSRGVATVVTNDPDSLFEDVRRTLSGADLAVANLESAVGDASTADGLRFVADPQSMTLAAAAGFDGFAVANNHAGDAGVDSVVATQRHIESTGMFAVGVSRGRDAVPVPVIVDRYGLRVAMFAFDLTSQGPAPGGSVGIARWDAATAQRAIREAQDSADVVTVGLHGGVEYLPEPDAALERAVKSAAGWGADVVWAHGSHRVYDVAFLDPDGDGRGTVVAYGLGNFLFDQRIAGTEHGLVVEVVVGGGGVRAYRKGTVRHDDLRVAAPEWSVPVGSATYLDDGWWELVLPASLPQAVGPSLDRLAGLGMVEAAAEGDIDGDGLGETVVALRRPYQPTLLNQRFSQRTWTDAQGLTAHLGVYTRDLEERWVAGTLPRPITAVQICDDGLAVEYGDLQDPKAVGGGAWQWQGFGFAVAPDLEGGRVATCLDVDLDGSTEPVFLRDES